MATQNFFLPSEITVYAGVDGAELVVYGPVSWAGSPLLGDADGDGDGGPVPGGILRDQAYVEKRL